MLVKVKLFMAVRKQTNEKINDRIFLKALFRAWDVVKRVSVCLAYPRSWDPNSTKKGHFSSDNL
jgi:hypothetical protein